MRSSRLGHAAVLVAVAALATPALADAYDAMLARAIVAKERAQDSNDPASWEDALALFQQVDRIRSTKETKYELGSAAARLRQDDLAVEAFESALALGLAGGARDKARAFVDEMRPQMARLEIVGPEGAEIWVGLRQRGALPLGRPLVVFAGEARVRMVHEGRELKRAIHLEMGDHQRLDLSLPASAPPPTAAAPPSEPAAPASAVAAPPSPPVGPAPERDGSSLGWALLVAGSATAIAGGAFVIGSGATIDSRSERLAELCAVPSGADSCATAEPGQRDAAQTEVDAIATWKTVRIGGWIGLGVGAAAAGTGLVLLLDRSGPSPRARLELSPRAGGAAFSVTGRL
jgi:hypothetical protein